ncbi:MAG: aminoacyl-tRNA hydrolase [Candidatus Staskawiczbacteria bacterium]|jgi:PTH1 family peptidyl-tRNA hydrolase
MIIIIGLGNPGEQYKNTRHNVGFMVIDDFAKKNDFPDFILQKKSKALTSEQDGIILVKPQTFMNKSGSAVKKIISKNKDRVSNIIVVHDDIDLPVGTIKIVQERGSAGHKGVESIIKSIGNNGLIRLRIGIGSSKKTEAIKVVLKNFSEEEKIILNEAVERAVEALGSLASQGIEKTMNEYNS